MEKENSVTSRLWEIVSKYDGTFFACLMRNRIESTAKAAIIVVAARIVSRHE